MSTLHFPVALCRTRGCGAKAAHGCGGMCHRCAEEYPAIVRGRMLQIARQTRRRMWWRRVKRTVREWLGGFR